MHQKKKKRKKHKKRPNRTTIVLTKEDRKAAKKFELNISKIARGAIKRSIVIAKRKAAKGQLKKQQRDKILAKAKRRNKVRSKYQKLKELVG